MSIASIFHIFYIVFDSDFVLLLRMLLFQDRMIETILSFPPIYMISFLRLYSLKLCNPLLCKLPNAYPVHWFFFIATFIDTISLIFKFSVVFKKFKLYLPFLIYMNNLDSFYIYIKHARFVWYTRIWDCWFGWLWMLCRL